MNAFIIWLQSWFPVKTKSLAEFIETLKVEGCTKVTAYATRTTGPGSFSVVVGDIANFTYSITFKSTSRTGRPIIFEQTLFKRFGSSAGIADSGKRNVSALKALLEADLGLSAVHAILPNIEVVLLTPEEEPFSPELKARLYSDALRLKLIE